MAVDSGTHTKFVCPDWGKMLCGKKRSSYSKERVDTLLTLEGQDGAIKLLALVGI